MQSPTLAPFIIFELMLAIATGIQFQVLGLYVMDRLGISGVEGAKVAAIGFMTAAGALFATQILVLPRLRVKSRQLMLAGAVILLIATLTELMAHEIWGLLVAQAMFGVAQGLAQPGFNGGAAAALSASDQGTAAGLANAVGGAGWVVAPLLGGFMYDAIGMTAPYWINAGVASVLIAFAYRSRRLRAAIA